MEIASRGGVPFERPILAWAIAQDVHKRFGRLEPGIRLSRNNNSNRFAVPGDGLGPLSEHGINQFTEFVLGVLEGPGGIHDTDCIQSL